MIRVSFRIAAIGIVIAIWILSLIPGSDVPDVPGNDKWHHALAYFSCMFCWGQLYVRPLQRLKLAIVFIAMGALIECIQYLTPTRSFELLDMLANATGVTLAWMVVTLQLALQRAVQRRFPG
ncbi:MAG: VanZ family protein [Betaproteobacteria bacterium]